MILSSKIPPLPLYLFMHTTQHCMLLPSISSSAILSKNGINPNVQQNNLMHFHNDIIIKELKI